MLFFPGLAHNFNNFNMNLYLKISCLLSIHFIYPSVIILGIIFKVHFTSVRPNFKNNVENIIFPGTGPALVSLSRR